MTDTITITKQEYDSFVDDRNWRKALEAGGVDNWDYYDDALEAAGLLDEDEDEESYEDIYGSPSDE